MAVDAAVAEIVTEEATEAAEAIEEAVAEAEATGMLPLAYLWKDYDEKLIILVERILVTP